MFKSIFSKYLTILVTFICICFLLVGGVQLFMSVRYWLDEKEQVMGRYADSVARLTVEFTRTEDDRNFVVSEDNLVRILRISSMEMVDARVMVLDNHGNVIITSDSDTREKPSALDLSALGDRTFGVTDMNGTLPERCYVTLRTLVVGDTSIGFVLVTMPSGSLSEFILDNMRIFAFATFGVLLIAVVALYGMTYRMVRPLREMATATRRFGEGDFSYRLPVRGRDETAELADALNHMALSLSSLENMRRSFVANVSHELKTPMTAIAGFVDGILDGTIPPQEQNKYLRLVSDEVKRLSRLVRTMLNLSRLDAGELKLSPIKFDLTDVACRTLLSFERAIEEKHIAVAGLEDCVPTEVTADPDLIGQVVYNLIDNAVKFTDDGGRLSLAVASADGWVSLTVRNSGAGIPQDEMPHLFERFYKSDKSRSLDKTGVGLGLYIVRNIIHLHGGEITVRSVEGEFAEFCFRLPAAPAAN